MSLYLNVPYNEKDEAKALGAKWNPKVKKWYIDAMPDQFVRFSKWILNDSDEADIAMEYIFIVEGQRTCWKCNHLTRVIGLGVGEFVHIYEASGKPKYELFEDHTEPGEELHLAWADEEKDVPPKLLQYLKANYSVKTGYSKTTGGKTFANHCDSCGALQGNWFLFHEPDSPLTSAVDGSELAERMKKLKIKGIPIDDNLQLNWNIVLCSNDHAYFKYGQYEELILSEDTDNEYISYEELYSE